jgi:hypothetical protein
MFNLIDGFLALVYSGLEIHTLRGIAIVVDSSFQNKGYSYKIENQNNLITLCQLLTLSLRDRVYI